MEEWEWSGSFNQNTFELENDADNSSITGRSLNKAFETMDFQSEIIIKYVEEDPPPTTGNIFEPEYTSYTYTLDGIIPNNLNFTSEIVGKSLVISIDGNLGFLKDYAPDFFLPENFTYDKYDSPDGFYAQGYSLDEAGGNYSYIVNQPKMYEVEFDVTVSVSGVLKPASGGTSTTGGTPNTTQVEELETKTTTEKFKIVIHRTYSAVRNQFMAGYLDEQVVRGDVEYFTYKGDKYYNSEDYLDALIKDLGWRYYF